MGCDSSFSAAWYSQPDGPDDVAIPSITEVRERFIDGFPMDTWAVSRDQCGTDFDRWLAAHDAAVLRAAAAAMRSHKDPSHWNLRDEEYPADMAQSPDRWLERRADRLAAGPEQQVRAEGGDQ